MWYGPAMITRRGFLTGLAKTAAAIATIGIPIISPAAKRARTFIISRWDYRVYDRALSDKEIAAMTDLYTRWDLYWQLARRDPYQIPPL